MKRDLLAEALTSVASVIVKVSDKCTVDTPDRVTGIATVRPSRVGDRTPRVTVTPMRDMKYEIIIVYIHVHRHLRCIYT